MVAFQHQRLVVSQRNHPRSNVERLAQAALDRPDLDHQKLLGATIRHRRPVARLAVAIGYVGRLRLARGFIVNMRAAQRGTKAGIGQQRGADGLAQGDNGRSAHGRTSSHWHRLKRWRSSTSSMPWMTNTRAPSRRRMAPVRPGR